MNKVILLGYLSRDPELKDVNQKDLKIARLSIAVNDQYSYSKTYFFNCVAFGKNAEYICANLKKGDFVSIDGNLTTNSFINGEGRKITYTEITIQTIKNLGRRAKNNDVTIEKNNNESIGEEVVDLDSLITNQDVVKTNLNETTDSFIDENKNSSSIDDNQDFDDLNWDDE